MLDFIPWNSSDLPHNISVNCFLPTGVLVSFEASVNASLSQIKQRSFSEAKNYPLYAKLKQPSSYRFVCISHKGKREQLDDERLSLRDVRPFRPFLKLVEQQGEQEKEAIESKIKFLMGKTPKVKGIYDLNDVEIASFRSKYKSIADSISRERHQKPWDERSMYMYPPDLCDEQTPKQIMTKLVNGAFYVNVCFPPSEVKTTYHISARNTALELINKVMQKKECIQYTLKINGKDAYLLGDYPLIKYKYIRDCIAKCRKPELSIVPKSSLVVEDYVPMTAEASIPPRIPPKTCLTVWEITARFKFKISHAQNISIAEGTEIGVRAGLYHGSQSLCAVQCSREKPGPKPVWNEYLEFDICMCDIPRMAKLCLTIYSKRKGKVE